MRFIVLLDTIFSGGEGRNRIPSEVLGGALMGFNGDNTQSPGWLENEEAPSGAKC